MVMNYYMCVYGVEKIYIFGLFVCRGNVFILLGGR